ncbi:MAG: hypothetical protein NWS80_06810, partial [Akkermansiaceae bacterium]|nr:hypothetical protein [Akkermansiaceae bacterium]
MGMKFYVFLCASALMTPLLPAEDSEPASTAPLSEIGDKQLIHQDNFDGDLSKWVVEQMPGGTT